MVRSWSQGILARRHGRAALRTPKGSATPKGEQARVMLGIQAARRATARRSLCCTAAYCLVVAFVLAVVLPEAARAVDYPQLFGSTETRMDSANLRTMLPQWGGVIERMNETPEPFANVCENPPLNLCELKRWTPFLSSIKTLDKMSQLKQVNDFMNNVPYLQDLIWETPLEFLHKRGMCRDYAVAKYWSLRFLGWTLDELRIVVLKDLNLRVDHAILVIYIDGQALVLDNQIKNQVVNAKSIVHYRPTYSINEQHLWIHRG